MFRVLSPLGIFILLSTQLCAEVDTLRYFSPKSRYAYYRDPRITAQASRFYLKGPAQIRSLKVTLGGESGSVRIRVLGHEGGGVAPIFDQDLMRPVTMKKERGIKLIDVIPSRNLSLSNNQFFVVIDNISPGVVLVTDTMRRQPQCIAGSQGYYHQLIRRADSGWFVSTLAFAVEVVVSYSSDTPKYPFADVTEKVGIPKQLSGESIAWADCDGDEFDDLLVGGKLFRNSGGESFVDITTTSGLFGKPTSSFFIDANNDAKPDILFLACTDSADSRVYSTLFLNTGNGTFHAQPLDLSQIISPTSIAIADVDNNGFLDAYIGQANGSDFLLLNSGELKFSVDSTIFKYTVGESGRQGICNGTQWIDYNNDSYPDLFISRDGSPDELWLNAADGTFERYTGAEFVLPEGGHLVSGSSDWADYDNNGILDALIPRTAIRSLMGKHSSKTTVLLSGRSTNTPSLKDITSISGIEFEEMQSSGAWCDIDCDGLLDFITVTNCPCRFADVYIQQADHTFEIESFDYGIQYLSSCPDIVWCDYNNDGRPDFAGFVDGRFMLFRNSRKDPGKHFVEIELPNDPASINAKVVVHAQSKHISRATTSGRGRLMQGPLRLHFGLGNSERVDSVTVYWTGRNNQSMTYTGVGIDRINMLSSAQNVVVGVGGITGLRVFPNPFTSRVRFTYTISTRQPIRLELFDASGVRVRVVVNEIQDAGQHSVEIPSFSEDGSQLPQGIYQYRLKSSNGLLSGRIVLVR